MKRIEYSPEHHKFIKVEYEKVLYAHWVKAAPYSEVCGNCGRAKYMIDQPRCCECGAHMVKENEDD